MFADGNTNDIAATAKHIVEEMINIIEANSHIASKLDKLPALIFNN